jgi:hypothetical protein
MHVGGGAKACTASSSTAALGCVSASVTGSKRTCATVGECIMHATVMGMWVLQLP